MHTFTGFNMNTSSTITDSTTYAYKRLISAANEEAATTHAKLYVNDFWIVTVMYKSLSTNQWVAKYVATEKGCE